VKISNQGRYNTLKTNNKGNMQKQNQTFNGGIANAAFNVLDQSFKLLDKNAMIQVSFVDTVSTNIPRTLVDLKTGLAAALETFRREFSGLFVNCLMPGLVVKGLANILPKAKEFEGTDVVGSWANGSTIHKLKGVYTQAQSSGAKDKTRAYVEKALGSLEGLDGKNWVKFADKATTPEYTQAVDAITEAIGKTGKERKGLLKKAQSKLVGVTNTESILRFNGAPQANLEETLRDVADLGSKFNTVKSKTLKTIGGTIDDVASPETTSKIADSVGKYGEKLKSFVNKKSLIGMGIVIAIAVSVQKINRAITRKQFDAEGAPIYKDFGKKDTTQKMDEKKKKEFFGKKLLSAAGMYGLAALSMMKKPSLGMFQFSGIFPTMDQCRWIASSTFASRMLAAEDENELRETTVRDLASFAGLYFLGDYVKKGVASGIEAFSKTKKGAELLGGNVTLLNRIKEVPKPQLEQGASTLKKLGTQVGYRAKQFGNWIKNTELKSAAEVANVKTRNLRNICRVADIAFSVVMLGVLLPKYNRSVTEKKVAEAKKQEEMARRAQFDFSAVQKDVPQIFQGLM
jgi:hypothetical protein